jgi:hypothetical protein
MDKTTEKKSEASENWHWRLQLSGSERDQKVERGLCWPPDRRHEEKPRAWPAHRLAGPGPRLDRRTERQKPSEKKDRRKPTGRDQFGRKSRRKTRWKNRPRALTCEKEKTEQSRAPRIGAERAGAGRKTKSLSGKRGSGCGPGRIENKAGRQRTTEAKFQQWNESQELQAREPSWKRWQTKRSSVEARESWAPLAQRGHKMQG